MFLALEGKFSSLEAAIAKMAEEQVAVPASSSFEFMDIKEDVRSVKQSLLQKDDDAKSKSNDKLEAQITGLELKIDSLTSELAPLAEGLRFVTSQQAEFNAKLNLRLDDVSG